MISAPAGKGGMTEAFLHKHTPGDNGVAVALGGLRHGIKRIHGGLNEPRVSLPPQKCQFMKFPAPIDAGIA